MSRTSKKDIILKAMRTIHQEYVDLKHKTSINTCSLCILFRTDSFRGCSDCPMNLFDKTSYVPCMQRKCIPIACDDIDKDDLGLQRVIKFYELAIAKIESMSNTEFLKTNYMFLVVIDSKIDETLKLENK